MDQRDGKEWSDSPGCEESDANKEENLKLRLPTCSDMICGYACLKGTGERPWLLGQKEVFCICVPQKLHHTHFLLRYCGHAKHQARILVYRGSHLCVCRGLPGHSCGWHVGEGELECLSSPTLTWFLKSLPVLQIARINLVLKELFLPCL